MITDAKLEVARRFMRSHNSPTPYRPVLNGPRITSKLVCVACDRVIEGKAPAVCPACGAGGS